MENYEEFKEKLDKIRDIATIEVYSWWGHRNPGIAGTIITKNKEMYSYHYCKDIPEGLKVEDVHYILKNRELSSDEYNKVIKFIEDEIINKEFHDRMIRDVGYHVIVNYNGIVKKIRNNKGFDDDPKIYDKASQLINELKK